MLAEKFMGVVRKTVTPYGVIFLALVEVGVYLRKVAFLDKMLVLSSIRIWDMD